MATIDFDSNAHPIVELVNIGGDLRLSGWDQPQFVAEADDEKGLRLDRDGDQLILHAAADCTIRLPRSAQVSVKNVGGDARVKSLEQKLSIGNIGGDLTLSKVAGAAVGVVGGDLSARRVAGDLQVGRVSGDLEAEDVGGAFQAGNAGGDIKLVDVRGAIQATAGGDVKLSVNFTPEHEYSISAGGDLECRLGPSTSARLALSAGGDLNINLKAAQVEGGGNRKTVTVGGGAAAASLQAGGDLNLTGLSFDPDSAGDFGENFGPAADEWTARFETQMADFERQMAELRAGLNFGPSREDAEKIAAKMRRAAEKVQRAAQQKAETARRQAEREAEHARRMAELAQQRAEAISRKTHDAHGRRAWTFKFETPRPSTPPRPSAPGPQTDPVSDEERLVILRMVEQGKISVADAEKLLAALENK